MAQRQQQGQRRFSDEEVGEIIRIASRLDAASNPLEDDGIPMADVKRIASELGIREDAVTQAVARYSTAGRRSRRKATARRVSNFALKAHGMFYATSIAGFAAIDLALDPGLDFVQYIAFGWGIILAWHGGLIWLFRRDRT